MEQITPLVLRALLEETAAIDDVSPLLLDVREPWEYAICRIDGSTLVPMRQIANAIAKLDKRQPTVVICHHGIRSQQVALYLVRQGFDQVFNLRGGIAAWAADVDQTMPTY